MGLAMINLARINEKLLALFKIKFVKDTLFLQAGTVVAIGANFITSVVLARILQPERYGIYALVFSLYGLIGLLANVGVGPATVTRLAEAYARKDEEEVTNLLAFFVKMSAITATFTFIVGFSFSPYLAARMYGSPEIGHMARLLFFIAPLGIMYGLVTTVLQSVRMMQQLTILESFMTILTSVFIISFVLLGLGIRGIVYGRVLATALSSVIGLLIYHRLRWQLGNALPSLRKALSRVRKAKVRKYLTFGFLIAIDKNIANLYTIVPVQLLGIYASPSSVGFFKLALGVITLPMALFNSIIRNLSSKLPEDMGRRDFRGLRQNFIKVTITSGLLSLIIIGLFVILVPYFVPFVYGEGYRPALSLIYLLVPYPIITAIGGGLGPLYRTLDKMGVAIGAKLITLAIMLPLGLVLISKTKEVGAALFVDGIFLFSIICTALWILPALDRLLFKESQKKRC